MARMNHMTLVDHVSTRSGINREVVALVLRATFDIIGQRVTRGDTVSVTNFGTWTARFAPASVRRNPQTGEPVTVPARNNPVFRWSPKIADAVRSGVAPRTFKKRASR